MKEPYYEDHCFEQDFGRLPNKEWLMSNLDPKPGCSLDLEESLCLYGCEDDFGEVQEDFVLDVNRARLLINS